MKKLIVVTDKILSWFCISLSSVLVVCVIWQVFSRYVLNAPSTFTDEAARFLFIWVGLMGAAYTLGKKRHLAIDLLPTLLETQPRKQAIALLTINAFSIFFAIVIMIYGGMTLALKTLATNQISPVMGIEMGLIYMAIPISGGFMVLYLIHDAINNLRQLMTHSEQPTN